LTGRVWLVGAGPGDAGLITVRGRELLERADVVVYDRLSGAKLLTHTRPDAELIDVFKAPGQHTVLQDGIHEILIHRARVGREVVRLKGGDPFVYGRGWEEIEACYLAGVPCKVVPGVSSATGVPTWAGIPLTLRGQASTVSVVTPSVGRGLPDRELPYEAMAKMDTSVVLMGSARLEEVTEGLLTAGRDSATAAAVVQEGTLPGERQVRGTLATIAGLVREEGLRAPMVLIVGPGAGLPRLDGNSLAPGFGPLAGRRVVVTRPLSAGRQVISKLRGLGANVIDSPLIRIDYVQADLAGPRSDHDWIVFTSFHGVEGFLHQLERKGLDARFFGAARIATIGPKTAARLEAVGIRADLIPEEYRARALVDAVAAEAKSGERVLFPCGTLAVDEVSKGLIRVGLKVETLRVYDTVLQRPNEAALEAFRRGVDAVLLYSPSAAESLASSGVNLEGVQVFCVGPTTADAGRSLGLPVSGVPDIYGDEGMIESLLEMAGALRPRDG
jgi:uroporphyrinogen III methyltransferase/synthase